LVPEDESHESQHTALRKRDLACMYECMYVCMYVRTYICGLEFLVNGNVYS